MLSKRILVIASVIVALLMSLLAWCSVIWLTTETQASPTYHGKFNKPKEPRPIVPELEIGDTARDFELPDATGGTIRLSQFENQPVVVVFLSAFN